MEHETFVQGRLFYNGFDFPAAIQARVAARPVMDQSGRYTKYVLYTITVECIVYVGIDEHLDESYFPDALESIDGTLPPGAKEGMDRLRRVLTEQGKEFHFWGKGFGYDFEINTSSGRDDIQFGPVVKLLSWEPIAANQSAKLVWEVEVALSECESTIAGSVSEFVFDVAYTIRDGLTSRQVTGSVEISNKLTSGQVTVLVDSYRSKVKIPVPEGFIRESQTWTLPRGDRILSFNIVDTQSESDYPPLPGITKQDVTHTMKSVGFPGIRWHNTIRGNFSVAPGFHKSVALSLFLLHLKAKLDASNATVTASSGTDGNGDPIDDVSVKPLDFQITNDETGRDFSASYTYQLITDNPQDSFKAAGLFTQPMTTSWQAYQQIMEPRIWNPRGVAALTRTKSKLITLCNTGSSDGAMKVIDTQASPFRPTTLVRLVGPDECKTAWVIFEPTIKQVTDTKTAPLYPTGGFKTFNSRAGPPFPVASDSDLVMHTQGEPRVYILFTGIAERMNKEIPEPKLVSYGGNANLTPRGEMVFNHTERMVGKCRVHYATWAQRYEVRGIPDPQLGYVTSPNIRIPR